MASAPGLQLTLLVMALLLLQQDSTAVAAGQERLLPQQQPHTAAAALVPHPRLRLTPTGLAAMEAKIAADPVAANVAAQLAEYGETLLSAPVVNCTLTGVENSLLAQARAVLDRTYTLGMLYQLDSNATWAQRAIQEMLHVTVDPSCASWNPKHFLDTAEMMHAVAVGYDWLYLAPAGVFAVADRAKVEEGLATRGLQVRNTPSWPRSWADFSRL